MKCLYQTLITLIISLCAFLFNHSAHAYGHKIGGWDLIEILSTQKAGMNTSEPLLEKGTILELMGDKLTIWSKDFEKEDISNPNIYCHPEFANGGYPFNDKSKYDERVKTFISKIGGVDKLKKSLKKNFNFPIKNLGRVYRTGENKDGKEPCKSIQNMNFYLSKDMKSVFMFEYPYIYYFKGDFGYIDGTENLK